MKRIGVFLLTIAISGIANAGLHNVTHHSRANCANNESISWELNHDWWFWVNSQHISLSTGAIIHTLVSGWQLTWRNAQVHWGEGTGGWQVHGIHWMMQGDGKPIQMAEEYVGDCSIYDGWWDH